MNDSLSSAISLAERVAFFDPNSGSNSRPLRAASPRGGSIRELWLKTAMRVDPSVTPGLAKTLSDVCRTLKIPPGHVEAYIVADPEVQALCVSAETRCFIQLTSGLVNLMEAEELNFVLGHEIGHWLLKHGTCRSNRESRAREISADRIGLLACGGISHATHAVMKHTSGLSGAHIRFDVGRFIEQLEDVRSEIGPDSSHPANVVRCSALLIFDTAIRRGLGVKALRAANEQVAADFNRFHDGQRAFLLKQHEMWQLIRTMVRDRSSFSKEAQRSFEKTYGTETLDSMKGFLQLCSPASIDRDIQEKIDGLKEQLD